LQTLQIEIEIEIEIGIEIGIEIEIEIEIEIGIEIGIDPCPPWHPAFTDRSNLTAELCQDRLNTVAVPGFSCLKPITRPFDSETDSAPAPAAPTLGAPTSPSALTPHQPHCQHRPFPQKTAPQLPHPLQSHRAIPNKSPSEKARSFMRRLQA